MGTASDDNPEGAGQARLWQLFDQAADLPQAEQKALLDAACTDDPALRADVERLLAGDARLQGKAAPFLQSPLLRLLDEDPLHDPVLAEPGLPAHIGRYRVLRLLGEGAMGAVYEAEQDNPRRPVALKVVRPGLLSPPLLRRFAQEAQILGLLHHPGIAAVYEAGVAEHGRPFFAMELIRGLPLDAYARGLPTAARLELLARVCDAVQHAHEKGVVHRDLKPGNILVEEMGQPKVLDFGVARATDADLQTTTAGTEAGQLLGTLCYMSPEQVVGDPAALDRRSDVYALGVILYELLARRLPYPLEHLPLPEVARVIREQEPSSLGALSPDFRGDVETIVGKALEKDRARRYASAAELAADIRRHLGNEPIRARRPSALYQLGKFARRHKGLTAALAVAAVVLVLITVGSVALAAYFKEQEAAQRELAREKTDLADHNRELAEENRAARERAEITLVDMQAARGLLAGERGDAALAALWFVEAARQSTSDPRRQADNRLRARNWLRNAVVPVGVYLHKENPTQLEFRPGGDLLLMRTSKEVFVWDWRRDRLLSRDDVKTSVGVACWSPDGKWLALGLEAGEVQLRSVPDGRVVQRVKYPGVVTALAFSPDGRYLATAGPVVRLWDVQAQKYLDARWEHPNLVNALVFNRQGTRLATNCHDQKARVFAVGEPGRPAPLFAPVAHAPHIPSPPAFIDCGRGLVTITGDRQLTCWDAETGKPAGLGVVATKDLFGLTRVVAGPQGNWFATGGWGVPQAWNTADPGSRTLLSGHTNRVEDLRSSADGTTLLTASWDQTARLWSLPECKAIGYPVPHMGIIHLCDLSGDGAYLATAQQDGLVRVWQRPVKDLVTPLADNSGRRLRLSGDGLLAAPGGWSEEPMRYDLFGWERLVVLDATTGQAAGPAVPLPGGLVDSCVCADNRSATAVSAAGNVGWLSVVDVRGGRDVIKPRKLPSRPKSVAARPHSAQVAVVCEGGELVVFDSRTGEPLFQEDQTDSVRTNDRFPRAEYTADGATLVTLTDGSSNAVLVRDADTGRLRYPPIRPILSGGPCRSFAISADARLLATAVTGKNAVQVWDLDSGRALSQPLLHPGDSYGLFHVSFSPDGGRVLTSHKDGQARLWDWKTGALVCPPLRHPDEVFAGWVTPDGRHALTACRGVGGTLHLWELTTGKPVAPPLAIAPAAVAARAPAYVELSPDRKRAFASFPAANTLSRVELAEFLAEPDLSTEDFGLLAELASARRIELGDESSLIGEQWLERWNRFREKRSAFAPPTPP